MTRPKLHNDEKGRASRGRPGRDSTLAPNSSELAGAWLDDDENLQVASPSDIDSFLAQRNEAQKKEPMRTITLKMPESVFQRFEKARGSMTKTSYILSLVEFAEKHRTQSV